MHLLIDSACTARSWYLKVWMLQDKKGIDREPD